MRVLFAILVLASQACFSQFYYGKHVRSPATSDSVRFDATATARGSAATLDVTLTIGANANPFVILHAFSWYKTIDSIRNITDNVKLTQACYVDANSYQSGLWYQAAPGTGSKTFRVYVNPSGEIGLVATSYYNVHQSTPVRGTPDAVYGNNANPTYSNYATNTSDRVFCAVAWDINEGDMTITGTGTQRYSSGYTAPLQDIKGVGHDIIPSSSAQSFTFTLSKSKVWNLNILSMQRAQ